MTAARGIDRWAALLALLALFVLLAGLGAGAWAHREDWALARRDLDMERDLRRVAAAVHDDHHRTGRLPESLASIGAPFASAGGPACPYRVVDANRFDLAVTYAFPRGRHGVLGFLDGAPHGRGMVWYSFDVRDRTTWTDGGPITLDPHDDVAAPEPAR